MKDELKIETWSMEDLSAQVTISPELFSEEIDVIQVKRGEKSVLAIVPWELFMEMLRKLTLEKMEE